MGFDQIAIVALLAIILFAFASERWRVEIVALAGLAAAFALGLVPVQQVFAGFASPAVVTVVEILLIVSVLIRSRLIDDFARIMADRMSSERALLLILCGTGAFVSVFMNNIGALALLFPVAISLTRRINMPPGRVLMALSFATLLGGMCSLTGTPANLVVNQWMIDETGSGMGYFDLGLVGFPLTIIGVLFLVAATPCIFARFASLPETGGDHAAQRIVAQRLIGAGSRLAGMKLAEVETLGPVAVHAVLRDERHLFAHRDSIVVQAGDSLLIECDEAALERMEARGDLTHVSPGPDEAAADAILMPESLLVGSRVEDLLAMAGDDVRVRTLASRRGRIEGRFTDLQFSMGDIVGLVGPREKLQAAAQECGLLLLSARRNAEPAPPPGLAAGLFALGVLATAFGLAPVEIAFGGVVLALVATGLLDIRKAMGEINWRIVLLLACMIPLGLAVEQTGAARVIADAIAEALPSDATILVIAAVLTMGIALTPFVDNVSTAIILSPIAAELSVRTSTPLQPLLIAVAIGASIDFLTPFGHHNNAIVMGAGNYRFGDFARLGAPLTAIAFVIALVVLSMLV